MNAVEIIKGVDMVVEGLNFIKRALIDDSIDPSADISPKKSVEEPLTTKKEMKELEGSKCEFDVEQLKSMGYNDFKKFAASLGVKCTGTRDEIMERILSLDVNIKDGEVVVDTKPKEDEKPSKSDKSTGSKKLGAKKADEPTRDEFDEQAERVAEDTDIEDIIEALADVDIKATKKNAVAKLAEALREGLIALEDEEEDEEENEVEEVETEAETEEDEDDITPTSYFPEYDPEGYNDPKGMTDERADAIEGKLEELLLNYSEGDLTDEEITSYLEDNASESEIDLLGDDYTEYDTLKLYLELIKRTIDNDGEEHEPGEAYEVNDKDVCCGHELKYVKRTKKYVCEHCGNEYEAE